MFKKLSPALVAISLVAVAQPALAQDVNFFMLIYDKTENTVTGKHGNIWTYAPGDRKVTVNGKKATSDQVGILMSCTIVGTPVGWDTGILGGIIKEISCVDTPDA